MTPADHGYKQCIWCECWRRPECTRVSGVLVDECTQSFECLGCLPGVDWTPKPIKRAPETPEDWHRPECIAKRAECDTEPCDCRPWGGS